MLKFGYQNIFGKRLQIALHHVKSHQEILEWKGHGNDIADSLAKIASSYNHNTILWPSLEQGENFICMRKIETNELCINDPRKEIAKLLSEKEMKTWEESSQGITARNSVQPLVKWKRETKGRLWTDFAHQAISNDSKL